MASLVTEVTSVEFCPSDRDIIFLVHRKDPKMAFGDIAPLCQRRDRECPTRVRETAVHIGFKL